MSVQYHPGKVNVVADALSILSMGSVAHAEGEMNKMVKDVHRLARLSVSYNGVKVLNGAKSSLVVDVMEKQDKDQILF